MYLKYYRKSYKSTKSETRCSGHWSILCDAY